MRTEDEIQEACERAAMMQNKADRKGVSKYPSMKYEDGLREAFDWIMENQDDDPTKPE